MTILNFIKFQTWKNFLHKERHFEKVVKTWTFRRVREFNRRLEIGIFKRSASFREILKFVIVILAKIVIIHF